MCVDKDHRAVPDGCGVEITMVLLIGLCVALHVCYKLQRHRQRNRRRRTLALVLCRVVLLFHLPLKSKRYAEIQVYLRFLAKHQQLFDVSHLALWYPKVFFLNAVALLRTGGGGGGDG